MEMSNRCEWAQGEKYVAYHDEEWGVSVHDDTRLFEFLILEGAQAGLSWSTILNRREGYREAYDGFDPSIVVKYDDAKKASLLQNPGIIRNRLKVDASVINAANFLRVQDEFGSFDAYIWGFVNGAPIINRRESLSDIPAKTEISDALSKDLIKRGFKFVGSTIMYAYMQACGLVNDHVTTCFRYRELGGK